MAGPDFKKIDALPAPVPGDDKPSHEPDTKKLDALLVSLNGSAERFQTLWFSFLGLTLYLAISVQLQGAHLTRASLADAELKAAVVWRTDFTGADLSTTTIWRVRADQVKLSEFDTAEPLTQSDIDDWISAATQFVPKVFKTRIIERFARLNPNFQTADQDTRDDKGWKGLADSDKARDPTGIEHRRRLETMFGNLVCGSDGAPYIARARWAARFWRPRPFGRARRSIGRGAQAHEGRAREF